MNRAGLRQVDLEKTTGISRSSLSRYLSGTYEPNADKLHRLAVALDVSEAYLLGYDVAPDREAPEVVEAKVEMLEEEMSRRMFEKISDIYNALSFSARVQLYEDIMKNKNEGR